MSDRISISTPIRYQDALPEAVDVAIIGGGVIGVFAALYLVRMGKRVLLCEKGRIAAEQSSRNWGWIRQQGRDPAELPIMTHALALWHQVNQETGRQCGVHTAGTIYLASTEQAMAGYEAWLQVAREHGLDTQLMDKKAVDNVFSGQGDGRWLGGIRTPSDARGEPWQAVPAVAALAHDAGVIICENCAVRALDISAGEVSGIVTEHGRVRCEQVVLAGGAWSSLFARRHNIHIPQLSVRVTVARTAAMPGFYNGMAADEELAIRRREDGGYTLALSDRRSFYPGPDAFRHFKKYLPSLKQGWHDIHLKLKPPAGFPDAWGTTRQWGEHDSTPFEQSRVLEPEPDPKCVKRMVERFGVRFPGSGKPVIEDSWAGMIDAMPDTVPVVDRVPGKDALIMATGMSGHGFGIGPGFGKIVAQIATGNVVEFDMHRFRFERFTDGSPLVLGPEL